MNLNLPPGPDPGEQPESGDEPDSTAERDSVVEPNSAVAPSSAVEPDLAGEPPSVTDPQFQKQFLEALATATDLVTDFPLCEIGSTFAGGFGPLEFTISHQLTELTERVILLERATRAIDAAKASILGQIPRAFEQQKMDADRTNTGLLSAANQIAAATRTSDQTISGQLDAAYGITEHFPELVAHISNGEMSFHHARHIAEHGKDLPEKVRDRYFSRAVEIAKTTTPGRLRRRLPKLAAQLSPETLADQHEQACRQRRVWVVDEGNGMAVLSALLPAPLAHAAFDRVNRMAKQALRSQTNPKPAGCFAGAEGSDGIENDATKGRDLEGSDSDVICSDNTDLETVDSTETESDRRTITEVRADILSELLLAAVPERAGEDFLCDGRNITGKVQVTIPVSTLTRKSDLDDAATTDDADFGELAGYGIIDGYTARWFAADAKSWDRVFLGEDGGIVATDNYEPTAEIRRIITARDKHCRFPGCLTPATRCDIDHTHDWAKGGKTRTDNLALLCRKHHTLKHPELHNISRWTVEQQPGGVLIWRDPAGREYPEIPDPQFEASRVQFREDPDDPDSPDDISRHTDKFPWGAIDPDVPPIPDDERPF